MKKSPRAKTASATPMQRRIGIIGMTNLGEARCAREAEIACATMAMVTD